MLEQHAYLTTLGLQLRMLSAPLVRVVISTIESAPNTPRLMVLMYHHAVSDAVSMGTLLSDISSAYHTLSTGKLLRESEVEAAASMPLQELAFLQESYELFVQTSWYSSLL